MATLAIDTTKVRAQLGAIVSTTVASEVMEVGDVIFLNGDSKAALADASASATCPANARMGLVVASANAKTNGGIVVGEKISVCWFGPVYLPLSSGSPDATKMHFVSETAGGIEDEAETVTRRIGTYIDETESLFFFDPSAAISTS